jgi:hypothetical protein
MVVFNRDKKVTSFQYFLYILCPAAAVPLFYSYTDSAVLSFGDGWQWHLDTNKTEELLDYLGWEQNATLPPVMVLGYVRIYFICVLPILPPSACQSSIFYGHQLAIRLIKLLLLLDFQMKQFGRTQAFFRIFDKMKQCDFSVH